MRSYMSTILEKIEGNYLESIGGTRNIYGFCEDKIDVYKLPKYRVALRYKNIYGEVDGAPSEISVTLLESKKIFVKSIYGMGDLKKIIDDIVNDVFSEKIKNDLLYSHDWHKSFGTN